MCDRSLPDVPLPSGWASNVKSAVLHVISLAQHAMVTARGWAANSLNARVRLRADVEQLEQENEWFREELRIKNARLTRIDPRHGCKGALRARWHEHLGVPSSAQVAGVPRGQALDRSAKRAERLGLCAGVGVPSVRRTE